MSMVKNIFTKANQTFKHHWDQFIFCFIFIQCIYVLMGLCTNPILSAIASIITCTLPHAFVVICNKTILKQEITRRDWFVGITKFTKLFPTYFMKNLILNILTFLIIFPTVILFFKDFNQLDLADWLKYILITGIGNIGSIESIQPYLQTTPMLIAIFIAYFINIYGYLCLSMSGYLVENYDISWLEAILKSWKMTKGHRLSILLLEITYLPRMFLSNIALQCIISLSIFMPSFSLAIYLIAMIVLPCIFYMPQIELCIGYYYHGLINQHPSSVEVFEI